MAKEFITINDHRPELFVMLRPTIPRYFFYYVFKPKMSKERKLNEKVKKMVGRSMLPNNLT